MANFTEQAIETAFLQLLDESPLNRIGVRDISERCGIYHSVNRDIFEEESMRLCEYAVTSYIGAAFPKRQLPEEDRQAVIRFFKCQLFGLGIDWINGGMQDEALEELRRISRLCRGLPELIVERSRSEK